ncbi:MAG: ArsR/SmtB family transcription factor [Halobacteriaceae archaeon]
MQDVFAALSCWPRLKIIEHLLDEEGYVCICEMDTVIEKDRSVVYRHFKKLEESGVIETRKDGRRVEGRVKKPEKIEKILKNAKEVSSHEC